ncbi:TPA: helix-turn-helix transcriptional regulator [Corynebacterium striatum]|nr:helix-turn-helix transcriptional regulator [Corynebacterium striatum]HCD1825281.1 helix-turn-helix transcriptional regulator [Corynebacterium striatum]HCD2182032.1 helix-turn-helix transcriptional regulator [Corynebacterium striatum]HCD2851014.1 helix-turn-helix transcriptional regulator [Corynebacterium striatum]HCD3731809.1 helix-turn-helix transcriptional regulator [Corynebacterium striatum]
MRINSHQQKQHDMTKEDLRLATGLSPATIAKLGKDGYVATTVLARTCDDLGVAISEICETTPSRDGAQNV